MTERLLIDLSPLWMNPAEGAGPPNGIVFNCPACDFPHKIRVRFQNHPNAAIRWDAVGDSFENLTVTPSIDGSPDCKFHGFITKGMVTC